MSSTSSSSLRSREDFSNPRLCVLSACNPSTVDRVATDSYSRWLLDLARASAAVANYCDHVEHNESAQREWITTAADTLRAAAIGLAAEEHVDLIALYAARLDQIEHRNPLWTESELDGRELALRASTWRQLQLAQLEHDRRYHPDVLGLTKLDQLRHYALHLAKLVGAVAEIVAGSADRGSFQARRLPDLLLFGLKLSTVTGERLPDELLPSTHHVLESVAG